MESTTTTFLSSEIQEHTLHWTDYLVFAIFLVLNIGLGIWQSVRTKNSKNAAEDFLVGNRKMNWVPIGLALVMSHVSTITVLGTPAKIYTEGGMFWSITIGYIIGSILAVLLMVPLLYPLKLTSATEYLESRYHHKGPKFLAHVYMILFYIVYAGISLYSPATAMESVTRIPLWALILIEGGVTIIYTTLGGMKASTYASVMQCILMLAGVIVVIVKGMIDLGGWGVVWDYSTRGNRTQLYDFNPSPFVELTTWTTIVGGSAVSLTLNGVLQSSVQRYSSVPSLTSAKLVLWLTVPGYIVILTLCSITGLVLYAWYAHTGCDPLSSGLIHNSNQLLPYYVLDRLDYVCLPGLFLSSIMAASMGVTSSCIASLATLTFKDVLTPCIHSKFSTKSEVICIRVLVVFYGILAMGVAYLIDNIGGNVFELTMSLTGLAAGPELGLYALGAFFPCATWQGAVGGSLSALGIMTWIQVGAEMSPDIDHYLDTNTNNCSFLLPHVNSTNASDTSTTPLESLYHLSTNYYYGLGAFLTVFIGLIVTAVFGCRDPIKADKKYHIPIFSRLCWLCLPRKSLNILQCKIRTDEEEDNSVDKFRLDTVSTATTTSISRNTSVDNMLTNMQSTDVY